VINYMGMYSYSVLRGGGGIGGLRQKTPAAKYLYWTIFKKADI
jgi:hypothetical protein